MSLAHTTVAGKKMRYIQGNGGKSRSEGFCEHKEMARELLCLVLMVKLAKGRATQGFVSSLPSGWQAGSSCDDLSTNR